MDDQQRAITAARHRAPGLHPLTYLPSRRDLCRYASPLLVGTVLFATLTGPAGADDAEPAPVTPASYKVPTSEQIAAKRAEAGRLAAAATDTRSSLTAAYGELDRLQSRLETATVLEARARDREAAARQDAADQQARLSNAEALVDQNHRENGEWAAKTYRGDLTDSQQMVSLLAGTSSPDQLAERVHLARFVSTRQTLRTAEAERGRAIAADAATRSEAASEAASAAHAEAVAAQQDADNAVSAQTDQAMLIQALLDRQQREASVADADANRMARQKADADERARQAAEAKSRAEAEAKRQAEERARAEEQARQQAAATAAAEAAARKAADEQARAEGQARRQAEEQARAQAAAVAADASAKAAAAAQAAQAASAQAQADAAAQAAAEATAAQQAAAKTAADQEANADAALKVAAAAEAAAKIEAQARAAEERQARADKAAADKAAAEKAAEAARQAAAACTGGNVSGFGNGRLPVSRLCPINGAPGHRLQADAARNFNQLSRAYAAEFGAPICVTDSYRTYESQVRVKREKPQLAATPGRSNHGWALAVDLCGGIQRFGTPQHRWMRENAPTYGWCHPAWARANGSKPEAWHWEFRKC